MSEWVTYGVRAGVIGAALAGWFLTQRWLGKRAPVAGGGGALWDGVHVLTARQHGWFVARPRAADALLVASSLCIDVVGIWMVGKSVFGPTFAAFVGLMGLFALRQVCQMLCPLPPPAGMIWRHPGVPSLFVTYGTSSDLFFSGHTAVSVYGACWLGGVFGWPGVVAGLAFAGFEVATVLVLRAHYTMDVFAGAVTALLVYGLAERAGPQVDAAVDAVVRVVGG